jgi:hypothetical protein
MLACSESICIIFHPELKTLRKFLSYFFFMGWVPVHRLGLMFWDHNTMHGQSGIRQSLFILMQHPSTGMINWAAAIPLTDNIDDVGYLSSLIDLFIRDFNGDPKRVYFSGSSNGGMMTYRLSCDIPEKIRAIAPFVSTISPGVAREFANAKPIPIIITSGTADSVIKWNGGHY